jgi:predicted metal-dependent phosphoesterase TrpH
MAQNIGLRTIAFADHNSIANVLEGREQSQIFGIEFIPCLELNTFHDGLDLHLLAYFIDPEDRELEVWLKSIHQKKIEQGERRLARLNELGFVFDGNDLRKVSQGRIPTGMSFLKAILSREENCDDPRLQPYINGDRSVSPYVNFYRDYLRGGKPAFVHMEDIYTLEAIQKIKELGGIPVLAHPSDTEMRIILQLVENGLEGLEVYTPYHNLLDQNVFRNFADAHGILMTAGSDFHGKTIKPDVDLGQDGRNHDDLVVKLKQRRKDKK